MDRNSRIMVVDDQEDLRVQVARMLQQRSADQETASLIDQIRHRIGRGPRETAPASAPRATYDVSCFAQGKEAFEGVKESLAENRPFAVMFLDMRMPPGWDGLETAQRIRSVDREIQIVIMTAYADYDQSEIAEKLGEPDKLIYLKKPFHPEEIRQLALALTEKWNLNRREKERQILANRLMRENGFLTRQPFERLDATLKCLVDAFVSFLDAGHGMFVQRLGGTATIRAATAPELAPGLFDALPTDMRNSARVIANDQTGACILPLMFPQFDGFIYIVDKKLQFSYDQLRTYLDILHETARGVLRNALQQEAAVGADALTVAAPLLDALSRHLARPGEALASVTDDIAPPAHEPAVQAASICQCLSRQLHRLAVAAVRPVEPRSQLVDALLQGALAAYADDWQKAGVVVKNQVGADLDAVVDGPLMQDVFHILLTRVNSDLTGLAGDATRSLGITARLTDDEPQRLSLVCTWTCPEPCDAQQDAPLPCLCQVIIDQLLQRQQGHCERRESPSGQTILAIDLPVLQP